MKLRQDIVFVVSRFTGSFLFLGSLVKDKIVCRANIMDVLSLHLDRSDCPGTRALFVTQRWEQLADELEVPDDIKRQCENFGNGKLTPSESMFEYLSITNDSLTVGTLKTHLVGLRRQDVVDVLGNVCGKSPAITYYTMTRHGRQRGRVVTRALTCNAEAPVSSLNK